jgi:Kef-type K+ transport system membrane component KefB
VQDTLAESLVALVAILAGARALGALAVRLRQPRIGGEMLAGLLIGGALLSPWRVEGARQHAAVLGPSAVQVISQLGQIGMILYLLLVGLTLSPVELRRNGKMIAATSLPVAMAAVAIAPLAVDWFSGTGWHLAAGATGVLVMAAALTISGLPFIARILEEREFLDRDFAATALGSSAVLTVVALLLLAVAEDPVLGLVTTAAAGVAAVAISSSPAPRGRLPVGTETGLVLSVIAALAAAWVSLTLLGTPLLGAFLVGIGLSQSTARRGAIERALGWSVPVILVPVFLAGAGARVDPSALDLGVITGAAVFTALLGAVAILGASLSSRFAVLGPGEASSLAALLNCRGMMLLALGTELRDHRLIGSRLFAVFYLCAIATTLITGPLFARARGERRRTRDIVDVLVAPELDDARYQRHVGPRED